MTPEEVRELLAGTVFGPVEWVRRTGSTNADLLAAARSGAPEGAVLVADHQTAGRGRRGRSWVAPPGAALLVSVLLRPRWPTDRAALLSPAAALAVREACAFHGAPARLKWPNDVITSTPGGSPPGPEARGDPRAARGSSRGIHELTAGGDPAGEAKLAGVLGELDTTEMARTRRSDGPGAEDPAPAVVVGMGVNLRAQAALTEAVRRSARHHAGLPGAETTDAGVAATDTAESSLPPVALEELTGRPVDRNELLADVLLRLDSWYRRLGEPAGATDLLGELRRHLATLGRRVRVQTPTGTVEGRAADLTAQGHLVVATAEGPTIIAAGDIYHLRSGRAV